MPQERANVYPYPTAADVEAAPGGREIKAARNILARHITGIPQRPYLMGQSDHAPVVRGVCDLTTEVYGLLDLLNNEPYTEELSANAKVTLQANKIRDMLAHHGCPDGPPATAADDDA